VGGAPAWRFKLPGEDESEAWIGLDGVPVGCTFRDPMRRAKVEFHARGKTLRVVVDGTIEAGWSAASHGYGPVDEAWFKRN